MIRGIGTIEGMSVGRAFPKTEDQGIVHKVIVENVEMELQQFEKAVNVYEQQMNETIAMSEKFFGDSFSECYKQHLKVLHDSIIIGGVKKQIQDYHVNAAFVLEEIKTKYATIYKKMTDDFLKKKADCIHHITDAIIKILLEDDRRSTDIVATDIIIVARNLDPLDLREIKFERIKGLIIEEVHQIDFAKAVAERWNIPFIYGVQRALDMIKENDKLIMDAGTGEVMINPPQGMEAVYNERIRRADEFKKLHEIYRSQRTLTRDNQSVCISSVASNSEEIGQSIRFGAEGVGLYRTEHLFIGRDEGPTESDHLALYKEAVALSEGKPICFRTFDVSANNAIGYVHIPHQVNPLLGYRSTRIMFQHRHILITQIKAIMQAAQYGDVSFVVPMVSNVNEILDIRLMIEDASLQLEEEGKSYNRNIPFGIVIETPAAAIMTSTLAQEVDFVYVDTDDLLILMTGTDPMNEMVDVAYNFFDPGFIRLMSKVTRAAHREGTPVGFYGQVCSNELLLPLMLGIGMDKLIVDRMVLGRARFEVNTTTKFYWDKVLKKVIQAKSGEDVKHLLEKHYVEQYLRH